jgi:CRP-like cAMP-binding protein
MAEVTPDTVVERFPGLKGAGNDALASLLGVAQLHEADAGEALVAEGTPSSELFMVLEGNLDIISSGRRMAAVGPGEFFGEVSLFDPGPAGASIVTEQGCTVLRVHRSGIEKLRDSEPAAAASLVGEALRSLVARTRSAGAALQQAGAGSS